MIVAYRGKSMLDGSPIVAVITGGNGDAASQNRKTGPMPQVWIVPDGGEQSTAGVCPAGCPFTARHARQTADDDDGEANVLQTSRCYVDGRHWRSRANDAQGVAVADPATIRRYVEGRRVRLGAFGDPAALPVAIIRRILRGAKGRTGYTHAWRTLRGDRLAFFRQHVMASVENVTDAVTARDNGWRTFRVTPPADGEQAGPAEVVCPAISHGQTCERCGLCNGNQTAPRALPWRSTAVPSITVPGHGGAVAMRIVAEVTR